MSLLLCGFMGSGKSSIVAGLSGVRPDLILFDLDQEIELREGQKVVNLITDHGINHFRKLEVKHLAALLSGDVIALGGGTVEADGFFELISGHDLVWIDRSFEDCWQSIEFDSKRPLTKLGRDQLMELFEKRSMLYGQAKHRVRGPIKDCVDMILQLIDNKK